MLNCILHTFKINNDKNILSFIIESWKSFNDEEILNKEKSDNLFYSLSVTDNWVCESYSEWTWYLLPSEAAMKKHKWDLNFIIYDIRYEKFEFDVCAEKFMGK